MELENGWLSRTFHDVGVDTAVWPEYMRRSAGIDDSRLTQEQLREAIAILNKRIKELKKLLK